MQVSTVDAARLAYTNALHASARAGNRIGCGRIIRAARKNLGDYYAWSLLVAVREYRLPRGVTVSK